jgi:hypothetical protein
MHSSAVSKERALQSVSQWRAMKRLAIMQWLSNTGLRVGNGDGDVRLVERAFIKQSSGLLNYCAPRKIGYGHLDTYY